ncbi:MAG TPA: type VI secretion system contractile sheath large subunit, partial [Polyangiales bacterium]|nr:type VI secretion system contractile sheath large subunit [Polyangiales bacterium]
MATLVSTALADATLLKDDVLDTLDAMIAAIDQQLSDQVNEIIHAPEFQQIESAWRGLNYLVMNSETDANLKLRFMNVGKRELLNNLRLYPGARWDQSPLFKQVYEQEFGQLGGQPLGAMVADYEFTHEPTDVQLMRALSKVAASAHMPLFAAAGPNLMGMDSWTELNNPRDLSKLFDTPDYAAWKSL